MESPYKLISIAELKLHPSNPRTISKAQLNVLKESITKNPELLQARPLIVTPDFFIIAGNQRYKACKELNIQTVPCVVLDIPEDKQKEIMIRDNVSNGEWDWQILVNEWSLPELESWGVSVPEFVLKKQRKKTKEDNFTPQIHSNITQLGELYELHSEDVIHKVIVGDSTDPAILQAMFGNVKADCVFTDPPYNVNYSGRGKKTSNTINNDNMGKDAFLEFLTKVFTNYVQFAKIGCPFYVCHSSSSQRQFEDAMESAGLKVKNQIIWVKKQASMGWGDYRWMHEPLFYATLGKKDVQFYGDRKQYTIWEESWTQEQFIAEFERVSEKMKAENSTIWKIGRDSNYEHPTQKPLQLIEIALNNSSKEGDIICDLFSGSGSTLIACEQLGRECFTAELDPRYADVTIARYINWKRKQNEAFHITKNGEVIPNHTFDGVIG